jgi:hypothetical protein
LFRIPVQRLEIFFPLPKAIPLSSSSTAAAAGTGTGFLSSFLLSFLPVKYQNMILRETTA